MPGQASPAIRNSPTRHPTYESLRTLTTTVRLVALSPPKSSVGDPVTESRQGWHSDGLGRFTQRYYLDGEPTYLVRNGEVESFDDPVPAPNPMVSIPVLPIGTYSRPIDPIVIAAVELDAPTTPATDAPVDDDSAVDSDPRRPCRRLGRNLDCRPIPPSMRHPRVSYGRSSRRFIHRRPMRPSWSSLSCWTRSRTLVRLSLRSRRCGNRKMHLKRRRRCRLRYLSQHKPHPRIRYRFATTLPGRHRSRRCGSRNEFGSGS